MVSRTSSWILTPRRCSDRRRVSSLEPMSNHNTARGLQQWVPSQRKNGAQLDVGLVEASPHGVGRKGREEGRAQERLVPTVDGSDKRVSEAGC
jgi:hypothetical protein